MNLMLETRQKDLYMGAPVCFDGEKTWTITNINGYEELISTISLLNHNKAAPHQQRYIVQTLKEG